jgi:2-dehydro-3-deoxyphosphogluconate aldolase/(4S)-4-hydroxy-2-oxoglutarate aldolase
MKQASEFNWDRFHDVPVVGILRGFSSREIEGALVAARNGGLTTVEITMDTPGVDDVLRRAIAQHSGALNLGAGTVTSLTILESALRAGAQFIVTPTLVPAVIARCLALGVPIFPGALSPTEIAGAWDAGASMVKVFPADALGPGFIRAVKREFTEIRLLPTGGVDLLTLPALREAGADGFGVGSPLFHADRVRAGDWKWVGARCQSFCDAVRCAPA